MLSIWSGAADACYMRSQQKQLRQLITEAHYVVDERAVADAILDRARVRSSILRPVRRGTRLWRSEPRSSDPREL